MKLISLKEFVEVFQPIKNQFNPEADYDGMLYAPIEFSRIAAETMPNRLLWTILDELVYDPKALKFLTQRNVYQGKLEGDTIVGYFVASTPYEYGKPIKVNITSVVAKYDDIVKQIDGTTAVYPVMEWPEGMS